MSEITIVVAPLKKNYSKSRINQISQIVLYSQNNTAMLIFYVNLCFLPLRIKLLFYKSKPNNYGKPNDRGKPNDCGKPSHCGELSHHDIPKDSGKVLFFK